MVISRPRPANQPHAENEARQAIVLVVEDEILVRSAVAEHLRGSGYAVIEAANAAEAIALFNSGEPIDVVFSDVHMPGAMDGLDLARWVDRHQPFVPVLLTSGNRDARTPPARSFLPKPYRMGDVLNRLHSLLAQVPRKAGSS
jgi:CheY-like chemotaxis protein